MLEKTNDPKTETLLPNYYAVQNYLSLEFSRVLESLVSLNGKVSVSKENIYPVINKSSNIDANEKCFVGTQYH